MIMKYTSISVGRNITNNLIIQAITEIKKYIQPIMTITMMPRVISRIRAIQSISTTLRRKLVMFVQEDDYDEEESEFSMFQGSIYISTSNITRCLQVYTLLCNQSTTDVWCNEAPVQIVRPKKGKFSIISNVLTITTKINSIVQGCGNIWFNPKYIINILLPKNTKNKYRLTYHRTHDNTFFVRQLGKSDMRFFMHSNGLHHYYTKQKEVEIVQTV